MAIYADACNLFGFAEIPVLEHKLYVLRRYCENLDREYDEIEKTVFFGFSKLKNDKGTL